MRDLSFFEIDILHAVLRLTKNAFYFHIQRKVQRKYGSQHKQNFRRKIDALTAQGLLIEIEDLQKPITGRPRRKRFEITQAGIDALCSARDYCRTLAIVLTESLEKGHEV